MKVKEAIKILEGLDPELTLHYDGYSVIAFPETNEQYTVINKDPLTEIVVNEEHKEVRFCSEKSKQVFELDTATYN